VARRLVDTRELCGLLSVKPSTIYKWVHEGRIPHYKLGKCVRFREDEVWDWVKKHRGKTMREMLARSERW
jgi:excisionase family DNA binding protein